MKNHPVYYAGPAKTPAGMATGSFGPTTAGRMDSYVAEFQAAGGSLVMLAKGNRSKAVKDACQHYGGFYLGSVGGPAARLAQDCIRKVEVLEFPSSAWRPFGGSRSRTSRRSSSSTTRATIFTMGWDNALYHRPDRPLVINVKASRWRHPGINACWEWSGRNSAPQNRTALKFGGQKINVRPIDADTATWLTGANTESGAADVCFVTAVPPDEVIRHLHDCGVQILQGPVQRAGALGPIQSVYCRDPDGNLIEISSYQSR